MTSFSNISDTVLNSGLTSFTKVSLIMSGLVGAMFIIRIVSLQVRFASVFEYGDVFKDVICFFAMITLFPFFAKLTFEVSNSLAEAVRYVPHNESKELIQQFLSVIFYKFDMFKIAGAIGEYIGPVLAYGFYTISAVLLLSIAPIVIFYSTILGYSNAIEKFFSAIFALSIWPLVWNIIGLVGQELSKQLGESIIEVVVFGFLISLAQILSPIYCVTLFSSLNPTRAINRMIGMESKL